MTAVMTPGTVAQSSLRRRTRRRRLGLLAAFGGLLVVVAASLAIGTENLALGTVVDALFRPSTADQGAVDIVRDVRVPRTIIGLVVGAAIGLAGALVQAVTRNPLADPGLLGVDAGAAAAVVTVVSLFGITEPVQFVAFALLGAGAAATVVFVLGGQSRVTASPVRLVLAGAAITAVLLSYIQGVVLLDDTSFQAYRFWAVGSLVGRPLDILLTTGPVMLVGAVIAVVLGRSLNAVSLGDDAGRALGAHPGRTRLLSVIAVTLLCGAATAAIGPIAFVGLIVPHLSRAICGPDNRWVLPFSMVLAAVLLLASDVLGRVLAVGDAEIEVGIVTAFLGAPIFIAFARRRKVAKL